ncbi:hypothetical protein L0F63_004197 [Massospora cicadina]|nr:hypothetical protein L0F63_004197 [Massospora cicadina]
MNGVISLVHFCEAHGPTVMSCTQNSHKNQPAWSLINFDRYPTTPQPTNSVVRLQWVGYQPQPPKFGSEFLFRRLWGYSTLWPPIQLLIDGPPLLGRPPGVAPNLERRGDGPSPQTSKPAGSDTGYGFFSQDPNDSGVIYTTTRYPSHPRLYAALRQACVRSLSCEFCPGHDGPVLFGDEKHGYTLSYLFTIRDVRARGAVRFYALTLLMTDRLHLVASATFIIGKFRALARFLQARAASVARGELERKGRTHSLQLRSFPGGSTFSEGSFGPHPLIATDRSLTGERFASHPTMLTSDQFLRRRSSAKFDQLQPLESLLELPHLMAMLHASFALILGGGAQRLFESPAMPLQKWVEPTTVLMNALPLPQFQLGLHSPPSSPGSTCTTPRPSLDHLGQLFAVLGSVQFGKLVFNLAIGNQVVVRSSSRAIVQDVMAALQDILPHTCFQRLDYEDTYHPIWICNLLGLQRETAIPDDVDLSSLVLLEVDHSSDKDAPRDMHVSLSHGAACPAYGNHSQGFVVQVTEVVRQCDYAHGGSLPFLFSSRSDQLLLAPKQVRLKLLALKEAWSCKARMFAQFLCASRRPPADRPPELDPQDPSRLLQLLKVDPIDLRVLRFFATAFRPRPTLDLARQAPSFGSRRLVDPFSLRSLVDAGSLSASKAQMMGCFF